MKDGVRKYKKGEITFDYFVKRLGIPEELANELLEKEELLSIVDQRTKLNNLYKAE